MKIYPAFFLALPLIVFAAAEKYGVYDAQGSRLSAFEAERYELADKTQQIKSSYPNKIVYVSSMQKGKGSKPASRYRFKAEAGAYIEAARKETFAICPGKEIEGTWISEHSVALNKDNCLSVQAPDLAGTLRILLLESSGRTDTVQVLVGQSYIQMGDYSHRIWVIDPRDKEYFDKDYMFEVRGQYESRSYSQNLIVDKTKFTAGDAWHYFKIDSSIVLLGNYKNENLEESRLPLVGSTSSYNSRRLANLRSKMEGLDTIHLRTDGIEQDSLSGYRLPSDEEWLFLMRAGASTKYYWGDEEDSKTVSRYAWIKPSELKPVAQLIPNRFGLYDIVGLIQEGYVCNLLYNCLAPECDFIRVKVNNGGDSFRLLRKTPRLQKLEKF